MFLAIAVIVEAIAIAALWLALRRVAKTVVAMAGLGSKMAALVGTMNDLVTRTAIDGQRTRQDLAEIKFTDAGADVTKRN
jgi:hypothetical protein